MSRVKPAEWVKEVYFAPCGVAETDEDGIVIESQRGMCCVWKGRICEEGHPLCSKAQIEAFSKTVKSGDKNISDYDGVLVQDKDDGRIAYFSDHLKLQEEECTFAKSDIDAISSLAVLVQLKRIEEKKISVSRERKFCKEHNLYYGPNGCVLCKSGLKIEKEELSESVINSCIESIADEIESTSIVGDRICSNLGMIADKFRDLGFLVKWRYEPD